MVLGFRCGHKKTKRGLGIFLSSIFYTPLGKQPGWLKEIFRWILLVKQPGWVILDCICCLDKTRWGTASSSWTPKLLSTGITSRTQSSSTWKYCPSSRTHFSTWNCCTSPGTHSTWNCCTFCITSRTHRAPRKSPARTRNCPCTTSSRTLPQWNCTTRRPSSRTRSLSIWWSSFEQLSTWKPLSKSFVSTIDPPIPNLAPISILSTIPTSLPTNRLTYWGYSFSSAISICLSTSRRGHWWYSFAPWENE